MGVMYKGARAGPADEIALVSHLPENDTMRGRNFPKFMRI